MNKAPPEDLICDLEAVRKARKLSKTRLAELAGTTRFQVLKIEKGTTAPSLPLALRLARVLGVTVEQLWHVPSYAGLGNAQP